jgi:hypothetical protein
MRLAYVITAYKLPGQFGRLLDAIWHPDDAFAVHVDAKTPPETRAAFEAAAAGRPNLRFVEPVRVTWGGFGLCEAEWRALNLLAREGGSWGHLINITGQDFPLKDRASMLAELQRRPGANHMHLKRLADLPAHFRRRGRWLCWDVGDKVRRLPIPNPRPRGFRDDWYGVGFHVLTREFCDWLVRTPLMEECRSYYRRTWHPHEHWLQAMIMASPFRDTVVSDNKRFIRWVKGSGNPRVLTMADLPQIEASDAFFARKFDEGVDSAVLDVLGRRLGARAAA